MVRTLDSELVILDVSSGRFFALNDVGTLVWTRLENGSTFEQLVDAVVEEFEVGNDEAAEDVADLVGQLIDAGLVVQ